ncbi:MAG: flagellar hook-basal body complex protein [Planctomycetota bacterium]
MSTTAMLTGLSGLSVHSRWTDVAGNNIANSSTTAFKSSRLQFENVFSRTLSIGSPPGTSTGGTNPYQVGLGVAISGTQRDMSGGSVNATGDARDLAVDGRGFFVVEQAGETFYTRDGAFRQDEQNNLVNIMRTAQGLWRRRELQHRARGAHGCEHPARRAHARRADA